MAAFNRFGPLMDRNYWMDFWCKKLCEGEIKAEIKNGQYIVWKS